MTQYPMRCAYQYLDLKMAWAVESLYGNGLTRAAVYVVAEDGHACVDVLEDLGGGF